MAKAKAVMPEIVLPEGCAVVERSQELEMLFRNKNKWLPFAQKLDTLTGTQALTIELGDLKSLPNSRTRVNSIKSGIKAAYKLVGSKKKGVVRFGIHLNKMWVWVNGL